MAALLHAHKPEHRFFDSLPDSENTVVLQKCRFVVANCFGDVLAFLCCKHNAIEGVVEDVILSNYQQSPSQRYQTMKTHLVERTRILRSDVQFFSQRAERAAV